MWDFCSWQLPVANFTRIMPPWPHPARKNLHVWLTRATLLPFDNFNSGSCSPPKLVSATPFRTAAHYRVWVCGFLLSNHTKQAHLLLQLVKTCFGISSLAQHKESTVAYSTFLCRMLVIFATQVDHSLACVSSLVFKCFFIRCFNYVTAEFQPEICELST